MSQENERSYALPSMQLLFIWVVLGFSASNTASAQSLNGFGLPQPSQTQRNSTLSQNTIVHPHAESTKYIERVKSVAAFLRRQYGFGFGDTRSKVQTRNLSGIDITFVSNGDEWLPPMISGCNSWIVVSDASSVGAYRIVHWLSGPDSACPQSEINKMNGEISEARRLVEKLGIPSPLHAPTMDRYEDSSDPCNLVVVLPSTIMLGGDGTEYSYTPTFECVISFK